MKNAFLKLIAITLAVVMLSLCLFSCDDTTSSDGSDTNTGNNVTQNEGSSNSSDNGNTDNGGNNGENSGENNGENNGDNGENGENGGGNTDSDRVSKLKYNNTVAKTSYAVMEDYVYSLVKFMFNEEGRLLGFDSGFLPNDLFMPFGNGGSLTESTMRVVYNAEGKPDFLYHRMFNEGSRLIDLKPSDDNRSFEGIGWISFSDKIQVKAKLTVDAEGRTKSLAMTVTYLENDFVDNTFYEFNDAEISGFKIVNSRYEYANGNIVYDTVEAKYSKTGFTVMATIRYTNGYTGDANTKVVKMETTQEGDSSEIEVQCSDGSINLCIDNGKHVSAKISDGTLLTYTYDVDGNLTLWKLGDVGEIYLNYDENGLLTNVKAMDSENKQVTLNCTYDYNDNGFLINCNTGLRTINFVSKTYTESIADYGDSMYEVTSRIYKMGGGIFLMERRKDIFDKNGTKLLELIAEVEIKDDSKLITVPVTMNFWCDLASRTYFEYLYQRITGEAILDVETGKFVSVNVLIETLDANGNVISSKTSTDLDIMDWL